MSKVHYESKVRKVHFCAIEISSISNRSEKKKSLWQSGKILGEENLTERAENKFKFAKKVSRFSSLLMIYALPFPKHGLSVCNLNIENDLSIKTSLHTHTHTHYTHKTP